MEASATAPTATSPWPERLRGFGPVGILATLFVLLAGNVGPIPLGAGLALTWARLAAVPFGDLGLRAPRSWVRSIAGGALFGAAFKLFLKSVVLPILGADPINHAYHHLAGNSAALPEAIFTMIVAAGIGEEIVFRGFFFARLRTLLGDGRVATAVTVIAGAALFGAAHFVSQGVTGVEMAAIVGLVYGTIYARTRSLPFLMAAHATFDLVALGIIYFDVETRVAHWFLP